jgi:hypothetical protein
VIFFFFSVYTVCAGDFHYLVSLNQGDHSRENDSSKCWPWDVADVGGEEVQCKQDNNSYMTT